MGQYRLALMIKWQVGLMVKIVVDCGEKAIIVNIPFIKIYIGLNKEAKGFNFKA
jgi:hypothetical protein